MVSVNYSGSYLNPLQVCRGCSSPLCSGSSTDPVGNLVLGLEHTKRQKAFFFFGCFYRKVFFHLTVMTGCRRGELGKYFTVAFQEDQTDWRQLIKEKSSQTLTGIRLACLTTVSPVVSSLTNYSVHAETDSSLLFMSQLYPGCSSTLFLLQGR